MVSRTSSCAALAWWGIAGLRYLFRFEARMMSAAMLMTKAQMAAVALITASPSNGESFKKKGRRGAASGLKSEVRSGDQPALRRNITTRAAAIMAQPIGVARTMETTDLAVSTAVICFTPGATSLHG